MAERVIECQNDNTYLLKVSMLLLGGGLAMDDLLGKEDSRGKVMPEP